MLPSDTTEPNHTEGGFDAATSTQPRREELWMADTASQHCLQCLRDFTLTRRRHHCRRCGRLVCGSCSRNRIPSAVDGRGQRACDACYTAHVTKASAAALRRQRAAREAELRGMGSLVAGSEHLVRVFFLDGSHRTVGFDRTTTTAALLVRKLFPPPLDPPAIFQVPEDFNQPDQFQYIPPTELISDVVSRWLFASSSTSDNNHHAKLVIPLYRQPTGQHQRPLPETSAAPAPLLLTPRRRTAARRSSLGVRDDGDSDGDDEEEGDEEGEGSVAANTAATAAVAAAVVAVGGGGNGSSSPLPSPARRLSAGGGRGGSLTPSWEAPLHLPFPPSDPEEELTALKAAHALLQQRYDSLARQHRRLQFSSSSQEQHSQQPPPMPTAAAATTAPIPIPIPQPSTLSTPAASPRSAFSVSPDKTRPFTMGVSPENKHHRPSIGSGIGLSVSPDKQQPGMAMGLSVSVSPQRASAASRLLFRAGSGGNRGSFPSAAEQQPGFSDDEEEEARGAAVPVPVPVPPTTDTSDGDGPTQQQEQQQEQQMPPPSLPLPPRPPPSVPLPTAAKKEGPRAAVVLQGWMEKRGAYTGTWRRRFLSLGADGVLRYCGSDGVTPRGQIPLRHVLLVGRSPHVADDSGGGGGGLLLLLDGSSSSSGRRIHLRPPPGSEPGYTGHWRRALERAVVGLRGGGGSRDGVDGGDGGFVLDKEGEGEGSLTALGLLRRVEGVDDVVTGFDLRWLRAALQEGGASPTRLAQTHALVAAMDGVAHRMLDLAPGWHHAFTDWLLHAVFSPLLLSSLPPSNPQLLRCAVRCMASEGLCADARAQEILRLAIRTHLHNASTTPFPTPFTPLKRRASLPPTTSLTAVITREQRRQSLPPLSADSPTGTFVEAAATTTDVVVLNAAAAALMTPVQKVLVRSEALSGFLRGVMEGWLPCFEPYHGELGLSGLLRTELEGVIQHEIADAYRTHKEAFTAADVLRLVAWFTASRSMVASKREREGEEEHVRDMFGSLAQTFLQDYLAHCHNDLHSRLVSLLSPPSLCRLYHQPVLGGGGVVKGAWPEGVVGAVAEQCEAFLAHLEGADTQQHAILSTLHTLATSRELLLVPLSSPSFLQEDDDQEAIEHVIPLALVGLVNDHARAAALLRSLGGAVQARLLEGNENEEGLGGGLQARPENEEGAVAPAFVAEAGAFTRLGNQTLRTLAEQLVGDCLLRLLDATTTDAVTDLATHLALAWSNPSGPSPLEARLSPTLPPKLHALRPAFADPRAFGRLLSLLLARIGKVYLEAFVRASARPLLPPPPVNEEADGTAAAAVDDDWAELDPGERNSLLSQRLKLDIKALLRLLAPFQDDAQPQQPDHDEEEDELPSSSKNGGRGRRRGQSPVPLPACGFTGRLLSEQVKPLLHAISLLDVDLQAIPPFARDTLLPLFGKPATQRLVRAALNVRADTGGFNGGFGATAAAAAAASGGGVDAMGDAVAAARPLREAVLQALSSLPEAQITVTVGLEQEKEEVDGGGALRPPPIELEFGPPAGAGVTGWWPSIGGE